MRFANHRSRQRMNTPRSTHWRIPHRGSDGHFPRPTQHESFARNQTQIMSTRVQVLLVHLLVIGSNPRPDWCQSQVAHAFPHNRWGTLMLIKQQAKMIFFAAYNRHQEKSSSDARRVTAPHDAGRKSPKPRPDPDGQISIPICHGKYVSSTWPLEPIFGRRPFSLIILTVAGSPRERVLAS